MEGNLPDLSTVYHTEERSPFDLYDPPVEPPDACIDPGLWRVAYALHVAHRPDGDGRCACGEPHPCEAWWQAVAGLSGACADVQGPPRPFVLCDEDGDVIAYGMTLPDGSAVTVQWGDGVHGSVGVWSSPGSPARLWSCAIAWFDRPVAPPPSPS
jgi:hypothetical protein